MLRANVFGRNGKREGKGFSLAELKEAGIVDIRALKRLGIAVDMRRKSSLPENIKVLDYLRKEAEGQ